MPRREREVLWQVQPYRYVQVHIMWLLPGGAHLPVHVLHLKHSVRREKKLLPIERVPSQDVVNAGALVLWMETDDVKDGRITIFILAAIAKGPLTIAPVRGRREKHRNAVPLTDCEEVTVLIW